MRSFKNANIYLQDEGIVTTDLRFDACIEEIGNVCDEDEIIALPSGATVLPGWVDIHVHGANGSDAMDASEDALATIARALAAEGTTSFLATTMAETVAHTMDALDAVRRYRASQGTEGARLIGVHLEGPFISQSFRGAQAEPCVLDADAALFSRFVEASGNCIRHVTFAPEIAGADALLERIVACGANGSIGHSAACAAQVRDAVRHGARSITHTYNAQSPLHHREIGTVGAALLLDELYTELIADTIHVSPDAMRLLLKCKPRDKVVLVTDAMRAKGLSDGVSELGGQTVYVKGGEARLADGRLAGSVLRMDRAVRNLMRVCGLSLTEAVDCATKNPARLIGVYDRVGGIRTGKCADFVVVDPDLRILLTIRGGRIVYRAVNA